MSSQSLKMMRLQGILPEALRDRSPEHSGKSMSMSFPFLQGWHGIFSQSQLVVQALSDYSIALAISATIAVAN
jgi:hypothetical protein